MARTVRRARDYRPCEDSAWVRRSASTFLVGAATQSNGDEIEGISSANNSTINAGATTSLVGAATPSIETCTAGAADITSASCISIADDIVGTSANYNNNTDLRVRAMEEISISRCACPTRASSKGA